MYTHRIHGTGRKAGVDEHGFAPFEGKSPAPRVRLCLYLHTPYQQVQILNQDPRVAKQHPKISNKERGQLAIEVVRYPCQN